VNINNAHTHHIHHYNCPGTLDWISTDNQETFEALSEQHQSLWNQRKPIQYRLNKYGFRSDEFTEEECRESITFIGCSNTFGVGLRKEDTWTHKVAKYCGLKEINLGIPAGSTDSAFRVYNEWQPIHKSKITCFLLPPESRTEIFTKREWLPKFNSSWVTIGPWSFENKHQETMISEDILMDLLSEDMNKIRTARNRAATSWIANQTDSQIIILPYVSVNDKIDLARDNIHMGIESHERKAQEFLRHL
jgi:hypothetical protein